MTIESNLIKIIAPTNCPACKSDLELVKDQLFCRNNDCFAKSFKQVEHFAQTMKIKGLGPKTIERLDLTSILDVYTLTEAELVSVLGSTMGTKIFQSIQTSVTPEASVFMASFSIPLFGNTAATKVAQYVSSFDDVTEEVCKLAGLGPKVTSNVLSWIQDTWIDRRYSRLMNSVSPQVVKVSQTSATVTDLGITVVITGKLDDFKNRTEAGKYLTSLGFTVKSSLNKATNFLINEEGKISSTAKKAETLGVPVTTINELLTQNDIPEKN